jgi:F0F1-type ATP synthase delta subunit
VLAAAHPATRAALAMLIAADRVGELTAIADEVAQQAPPRRDEELAEVYVAGAARRRPRAALKAALERATGKKLDLKVSSTSRRRWRARQDRRHRHRRLARRRLDRPAHPRRR